MRLPKKQTATLAQHEFEFMFDFSDITQPSKLLVGVSSPPGVAKLFNGSAIRQLVQETSAPIWGCCLGIVDLADDLHVSRASREISLVRRARRSLDRVSLILNR
jgi:hypothetical protein